MENNDEEIDRVLDKIRKSTNERVARRKKRREDYKKSPDDKKEVSKK